MKHGYPNETGRRTALDFRRPLLLLLVTLAAMTAAMERVMGYEQPAFTVEKSYPDFELRRYAPYIVAETEAAGSFEAARNEAFLRLFKYISGNNRQQRTVAVTAPAVSASAQDGPAPGKGEEIAMTIPVVTHETRASAQRMQFALPARYTLETAPEPLDGRIRLRTLPARWLAVRSFSGRSNQGNFRDNEAALRAAIAQAGLRAEGTAEFAVYNGPFTLWFMRHNEVMVQVHMPAP